MAARSHTANRALVLLFAAWTSALPAAAQTLPQDVRYGRDVRPILADRCFRCHGPDEARREGKLRLDDPVAAQAARDGGAAIVPGDPDASLLWLRVTAEDFDERMPPKSSGKPPLTAQELAIVKQWLRDGAAYEPHWAFSPPQRPELPSPGDATVHPIDAFVNARLARAGLAPGPRAEPATRIRRTFLVLTGLPPLPAELDEWLAFGEPGAHERLVDHLLDDEPYRTRHAEHFAGPWLDAARYADTSGIHMDAGRQIWPWRDWLIEALRTDLPFDQFVRDQLAGDLLPAATTAQRTASGFLRLHVTTDEGGAIDEEYRVEYAAERTATVGSVMLGLTVACARCHDHKYDPIRQEDYYRLFSFFNSNQEPGLYSQDKDSNRALEPFLQVPRPEQAKAREILTQQIADARRALTATTPEQRAAAVAFRAETARTFAARWVTPTVTLAASQNGAVLTVLADGSVLATGENPPTDVHTFELSTDAVGLRWLALEALPDPTLPLGKVGRAANGNAVLRHVQVAGRPRGSEQPFAPVPLVWAMADVEQQNGDFAVGNALDGEIGGDDRGWAIAAHQQPPGPRHALFLAGAPFGAAGGTELRVTLTYDSVHRHHVLGRVRFRLGASSDELLARLPLTTSAFYAVGPFSGGDNEDLYSAHHGPESATAIEPRARFLDRGWKFAALASAGPFDNLPKGRNATYVGQVVHSPVERDVEVALGSDDGFQLFVNGTMVGERRVDRAVAADQDRVRFHLRAGRNIVVQKVVNTGGDGGFSLRHLPHEGMFGGDLQLVLLPDEARSPDLEARIDAAYREQQSPTYLALRAEVKRLEQELAALETSIPRTMVMSEASMPRPTFVLQRGDYDKPDPQRPVERTLPALFGALPADAPKNRLGLAQWMVSPGNPLLLRVAVNRLWQTVFGNGIVRTSEDFGHQGEWPSHPELLDWLACEFRDRGLSSKAMLRLLVTSETFCRTSARDPGAAEVDPDNRLLAWFPRRRLAAEAIRDQALFVAGLLVERTGGPSVKPPQPAGLWQEVAMVQSNTRNYEQSTGDDPWRRSLYVYWKRACPPPNLLVLDAPTREFCTIRRAITNTPLQALTLWNDPQFAEAARVLAERAVRQDADAATRLQTMHRRCTGHPLEADGLDLALDALANLQKRFAAAPADAEALRAVGDAPVDAALSALDVAPFVVMASAFLNLDATLYLD